MILIIEELTINCITNETFYKDKRIDLTRTEQFVLERLAKRNDFVTQEQLREMLSYTGECRVYINKLRRKLGAVSGGKNFIDTLWGYGYRLKNPNEVKYSFQSSKKDVR